VIFPSHAYKTVKLNMLWLFFPASKAKRQDLAIVAVKISKPRNANTYCPNYCCTGGNRIVVFRVCDNKPE